MPHPSTLAAALAVALFAAGAAQAQQSGSVRGAANASPSATARTAQAAPKPGGLRPLFPAGITSGSGASQSTDRIARTTAPVTAPTTSRTTTTTTADTTGQPPGTVTRVVDADGTVTTTVVNADGTMTVTTSTGTPIVPAPGFTTGGGVAAGATTTYDGAAATTVLGGPAAGFVAGPPQFIPGGGLGFSAVDIARSFIGADANRDGELTRTEARRLAIAGMSFEEMDRNYDGVVSRSEYEDGLR